MTPQREQELRQMAADEIEANDQTIGELLDEIRALRDEVEFMKTRSAALLFTKGMNVHLAHADLRFAVEAHADAAHLARRALNNRIPNPTTNAQAADRLMTTLRNVERVLKECK